MGVELIIHMAPIGCRLFTDRRLNGEPVISHPQFVDFLLGKTAAARVTRLAFEGQNHVVYVGPAAP